MGQFSWLDCITEEQIVDDKERDVYVLIPKEFGGGHIVEHCYDGYGHFGGKDIFDLVATWNREVLSDNPNFIFPYAFERAQRIGVKYNWNSNYHECIDLQIHNKPWYEFYKDLNLSVAEVCNAMTTKLDRTYPYEWRYIDIDLACYDEDNEALPFPIKITHDPHACYEFCPPSKSDPNQGWETYDEDDEWEEEQYWTVEDEEENEY